MKRRTAMVWTCLLCALAVSAFAAQGAFGQAAFECASAGGSGAGFKDAHCKESTASGAAFKHVAISGSIPTTLTNETTGGARSTLKLKSVQSGVTLELQATEVEGTGTLENKEEGCCGWMKAAAVFIWKHVTITIPIGKGCIVVGGQIESKKLSATTQGLTNEVKFLPFEGETLATFTVEGCTVTALNHVYTLTGSVKGSTEGATVNFTHTGTTGQSTLKLFGQNAGLEGSLTMKRSSTGNGIALT